MTVLYFIFWTKLDNWLQRKGEERPLPGLRFTSRQLFWISSARVDCSKMSDNSLIRRIIGDTHTPSDYRIIGRLQNNLWFARDFGCKTGTRMNPQKKCNVW